MKWIGWGQTRLGCCKCCEACLVGHDADASPPHGYGLSECLVGGDAASQTETHNATMVAIDLDRARTRVASDVPNLCRPGERAALAGADRVHTDGTKSDGEICSDVVDAFDRRSALLPANIRACTIRQASSSPLAFA